MSSFGELFIYRRGAAPYTEEARRRLSSEEFEKGRKIKLSLGVAAMAFGISAKDLRRMSERGKSLSVKVEKGEAVIELMPQADEKACNLWEKMIESLKKGRDDASKAMKEYRDLAVKIQHPFEDVHQLQLYGLWVMLPPSLQDQLASEGISPRGVKSNIGIARSGP